MLCKKREQGFFRFSAQTGDKMDFTRKDRPDTFNRFRKTGFTG